MAPSDDGLPAFVPVTAPLVAELPAWTPAAGANVTLPLTERAALVRVLGGWLTSGKAYASEVDDFVDVHVGTQSLRYTWSILWGRVDPVVRAGVEPVFVWDNVPWGFVENVTAATGASREGVGREADGDHGEHEWPANGGNRHRGLHAIHP